MTNFKEVFKAKAKAKTLTSADMLALCIYRTIKAKSENKAVILDFFIKKAFSPGAVRSDRPYPYHGVTQAQWYLNAQARQGKRWNTESNSFVQTNGTVLGVDIREMFEDSEEVMFRELLASVEQYGYKDAQR